MDSDQTIIELQKIIGKLESVPTQPDKWDATVKSRIYYEVRECTLDLIRLKNTLEQKWHCTT